MADASPNSFAAVLFCSIIRILDCQHHYSCHSSPEAAFLVAISISTHQPYLVATPKAKDDLSNGPCCSFCIYVFNIGVGLFLGLDLELALRWMLGNLRLIPFLFFYCCFCFVSWAWDLLCLVRRGWKDLFISPQPYNSCNLLVYFGNSGFFHTLADIIVGVSWLLDE